MKVKFHQFSICPSSLFPSISQGPSSSVATFIPSSQPIHLHLYPSILLTDLSTQPNFSIDPSLSPSIHPDLIFIHPLISIHPYSALISSISIHHQLYTHSPISIHPSPSPSIISFLPNHSSLFIITISTTHHLPMSFHPSSGFRNTNSMMLSRVSLKLDGSKLSNVMSGWIT